MEKHIVRLFRVSLPAERLETRTHLINRPTNLEGGAEGLKKRKSCGTPPGLLKGVTMRELTADLSITLDGFASGVDEGPYFGYFGRELESWVRNALDQPQRPPQVGILRHA